MAAGPALHLTFRTSTPTSASILVVVMVVTAVIAATAEQSQTRCSRLSARWRPNANENSATTTRSSSITEVSDLYPWIDRGVVLTAKDSNADHSGGAKSDRSMSPSTMTEEERRELIARQHRALYGNESNLYNSEPGSARPLSQDARVSGSISGPRNGSPLAYDPYGVQSGGQSTESSVQMPQRDQAAKDSSAGAEAPRANSNSSPSSNPTAFGLFDNAQQSSRTSTASPAGSPPRSGNKAASGVAPIGTRPAQNQTQPGAGINKRSTTPLPSPLSYGFSASDSNNSTSNNNGSNANNNGNSGNNNNSNSSSNNNNNSNNSNNNERSTSASSNPSSSVADKGVGLGWGSNSGVWGTGKNTLGVQASVWG